MPTPPAAERSFCRAARLFALVGCLLPLLAAASDEPRARPSVLVVVIDTLRADAVSAYGDAPGTTPALDRLAEAGLLFEHAFAPAPWTLPSHATLLTGLGVEQHGVGLGGRTILGPEPATLAERLSAAGYRTGGFSENPVVSPHFGLERGFAHFSGVLLEDVVAADQGFGETPFDVVALFTEWVGRAGQDPPFFGFVNLFDPHDPYEYHPEHTPLPPGVTPEEARDVRERLGRLPAMCDRLPEPRELDILRALYWGDVRAADAKLEAIVGRAQEAAGPGGLITVVTSDHGEHLGEHRLLGHEFSVRNVLLHVPLVVHGLPSAGTGRVATPVELADLVPSVLAWTGLPAAPELDGLVWSSAELAQTPPRNFFAAYSDAVPNTPPSARPVIDLNRRLRNQRRLWCAGREPVFGEMAALTRFPFKWIWFEDGAPQLFDLSQDPGEQADLRASEPEISGTLSRDLERLRMGAPSGPATPSEPALSQEGLEALRALGYLE
ncbi:MAG: sulfatase [Myxococcota bacterium]